MPKLSVLVTPSAGGRADDVVARLREAMYLGILNPGDQLPPEVDLARQFGVAPMTVRDALADLRRTGLIETRRGRTGGSFVRRFATPPSDKAREQLAELTLSQLRDLVDEHEGMSGQAAALAAERAADTNARRLFRFTEELRAAHGPAECIRADSRFHVEMAVAAQSERLTRHEVRLQAEICGMLWYPEGPPAPLATIVAEHHEIAVAIASGAEDVARRRAQDHARAALARLTSLHHYVTENAG